MPFGYPWSSLNPFTKRAPASPRHQKTPPQDLPWQMQLYSPMLRGKWRWNIRCERYWLPFGEYSYGIDIMYNLYCTFLNILHLFLSIIWMKWDIIKLFTFCLMVIILVIGCLVRGGGGGIYGHIMVFNPEIWNYGHISAKWPNILKIKALCFLKLLELIIDLDWFRL